MNCNRWMTTMVLFLTLTGLAGSGFAEFDRRAKSGESLTVAFLGGSLTWGANATDPQRTSYRALIGERFRQTYPAAHFRFIDAAIGGTGAQLGVFRLERDVLHYKPDLMFLDFTLNDDAYRVAPLTMSAYESIIRRALERGVAVIPVILAARDYATESDLTRMVRRTGHLKMAEHYRLPVGDAVLLMNTLYRQGKLDPDAVWPPDSFDNTHPTDPGYRLYAQAVWEAFESAVKQELTPQLPEMWYSNPAFRHVARIPLSSLGPLPEGWTLSKPETGAVAFDFVMSRWLDDLVRGANNRRTGRADYELTGRSPEPLRLTFKGSSLLLFGESKPESGQFSVEIDGKALDRRFDGGQIGKLCNGTAHMVLPIVDGLDGSREHTLTITPCFAADRPEELRIESICVAGDSEVWVRGQK